MHGAVHGASFITNVMHNDRIWGQSPCPYLERRILVYVEELLSLECVGTLFVSYDFNRLSWATDPLHFCTYFHSTSLHWVCVVNRPLPEWPLPKTLHLQILNT